MHGSHTGKSIGDAEGRSDVAARRLLDIVGGLADELHPRTRKGVPVTLDSALERDLGVDSLGRVELTARIEKAFQVRLPEQLIASAETPRDLLRGVMGATAPAGPPVPVRESAPALAEVAAAPLQAETLVEVLEWHVASHPDRPHIRFIAEPGREEMLTFSGLKARATAVAAGLLARDLRPGEAVGIMLPTGLEFFHSFFGALLAGGIPVPIYPPVRPSQIEDHLRRQAGILNNAHASILITVAEALRPARLLRSLVEGMGTVATVEALAAEGGGLAPPVLKAQDIALLQYTSGSTGNPKGVILSHANLLANVRAMGEAVEARSRDVFVSWLPLYHDMGLIGAWLGSLYHASLLVLMSPFAFLTRPERWLWAIHTNRGTLSAAPNFAYELCLRKIDDGDIEGLDLSPWRRAFNGAEPVSPDTVRRFTERFAPYGFRPEAMAPVYGLAECSVGLAFPPLDRGPIIDRVRREPFMHWGKAIRADTGDPDALRFVSCGEPLPGHQIRVVDAAGGEAPDRGEGRLQFRGPSATSGYFRNPEETRHLFDDGWLESGDLAYIADGEIYLTGRAKDMIIRAGRNIYPYELEEAVGNIPGVRKGCVAVFGSPDPVSGTERMVIMAETRETDSAVREGLVRRISDAAVDMLSFPPDDIVLAPPRTILKTSSGKIRRASSRDLYERGAFAKTPRAVWWQVARLTWASLLPRLRRAIRIGADMGYGAYAWTVFGLLTPPVWLLVALLPRASWSRRLVRSAGRLLLRLSGIGLVVDGLEHLPRPGPCILVSNHASYLDSLVLSAALPATFGYVAKRELTGSLLSRVFLERLGASFVERFDPKVGVEDTRRILHAVRAGASLVIFPEGTFRRMPGLLPFRMGAFVVAAEASVPVVPVGIRGTRSLLRSGEWLPRRGTVSVAIGPPILPSGTDWSAAIALRDAARAEILRCSGEPGLAPDASGRAPEP